MYAVQFTTYNVRRTMYDVQCTYNCGSSIRGVRMFETYTSIRVQKGLSNTTWTLHNTPIDVPTQL